MGGNGDTDLRRHILDAARSLLVAQGYAGLSMRRIGRAVGVSATSIYLYFENKDELFHTLIDEGMAQLFEQMQRAAAAADADPVARLRALCGAYLDFAQRQPEYYEIMFVMRPVHARRYPAEKYRRARRSLDLIREALVEGAAKGVFVVGDPRVAASIVWATLHGTMSLLLGRRLDAGIVPADFVEAALTQAIRGLASARSGSTLTV